MPESQPDQKWYKANKLTTWKCSNLILKIRNNIFSGMIKLYRLVLSVHWFISIEPRKLKQLLDALEGCECSMAGPVV